MPLFDHVQRCEQGHAQGELMNMPNQIDGPSRRVHSPAGRAEFFGAKP
jgi:hypothetical protein